MKITKFFALLLLPGAIYTAYAQEGPPVDESGVIGNPTLKNNQALVNMQAVKSITTFMNEGAQECDDDGQNCRSLFGKDDNLDIGTLSFNAGSIIGASSYSYSDTEYDAASISTQTGVMAIACGNTTPQLKSGIAFKLLDCRVTTNGDAYVKAQLCTAPVRGMSISQETDEDKLVDCSDDPTASNYLPPAGMFCRRPTCDSEPVDSMNGWSSPFEMQWTANMPETATEAEKSNNGLAMVFYPKLGSGIPASFEADSDNMTAVKIVQTAFNEETRQAAVGFKVAYRFKTQMDKNKLATGAGVNNPNQHTAQWDTLVKLQANPLVAQYGEKYGRDGTECLTNIQQGIMDGKVEVCDRNYTNESGIKPIALEATIVAEGERCSSADVTCVKEVVNTNTWTHACTSDVPLALRTCTTTTDYQIEHVSYTRTRSRELCTEKRTWAQYSCQTEATVKDIKASSCPAGAMLVNTFSPHACWDCIDSWQYFRVSCGANDTLNIFWHTATPGGGYYSPIANYNVTQKGYVNSHQVLPAFCSDGSGNVHFTTTCGDTTCTYKIWITGTCPGSTYGITASATAPINYIPEYGVINGCSLYESSR